MLSRIRLFLFLLLLLLLLLFLLRCCRRSPLLSPASPTSRVFLSLSPCLYFFLPFSLFRLQCIPAACPLPSPVAAYSGSIRRVVSWRTARAVPVVFYVRIIFSTRSHARQCDRHRRVLTDARDKFSNSFGRSRASDTRLFADESGMRRAARQSVILFFWRATSVTSVYFMYLRSMCVRAVVFLLTFNVVISLMLRIDFLRISYGRCSGRYDF